MKTEHTPEPWIAEGSFIGTPNGKGTFYMSPLSGINQKRRESDARRIVACVNACAGISTEALESEGSAVMGWNRTASKLIHATKQRDELLAALELCIPELRGWMNAHGEDIGTIAAIKAGKAAIASVKEKPNAAD